MSSVVFVNSRYVKSLQEPQRSNGGKKYGSVEGHLKYITKRSQELELSQRGAGVFDKFGEHVDWEPFYDRVKNNPALKHGRTVKVHHVILSMRENHYRNYHEITGKDFLHLTRKAMADLETKFGVNVDWVAAYHPNSGHPHVHLSIKAVSDPRPGERAKRIKLGKDEIQFIKDRVFLEVEPYYRGPNKSRDFRDQGGDYLKDLSQAVNTFIYELEKMQKVTEREDQQIKQKKPSKDKNKSKGR